MGPQTTSRDNLGHEQGALRDGIISHNKAVADLETLRANYAYMMANDVLTNPTAAIATTTTKAKTTASTTYSNQGSIKAKGATDNLWTLGTATSNTNVAPGFFQKYLLALDAAGNPFVYEGTQAASAAAVKLPSVATLAAAGVTVIETLTVQNGSGSNFVPGTTALNAASITSTFLGGADPLFLTQATALTASQVGNLGNAVILS